MRIEQALAVPARGGYFNEDLDAIRAGAARDGFVYTGAPVAAGFDRITEPSEAVSIVLVLDGGLVAFGDAVSVEYPAVGGRRGRFRCDEQLPHLRALCAALEGRTITSFLAMSEALEERDFGPGLHRPAALYGASQALLQAVALKQRRTPAEVLAAELGVKLAEELVPIYVQSGEERYRNADKMILKEVDALPHGLINEVETKLGRHGELLAEYVSWLVARIAQLGRDGYRPELHLDVYGTIGQIFAGDPGRVAVYLADLGRRAAPHQLCVESPLLAAGRAEQIEALGAIRAALDALGSDVQLIVDEWANDLDDIRAFVAAGATHMVNVKSPDLGSLAHAARAVLECRAGGVRPILGGSCTDTDQSARTIAHVALATRPAWVLARPGMGVDEGLQIVHNEMARTLALVARR